MFKGLHLKSKQIASMIPFQPGSRTEHEPEFYKPILHHFFRTLTEPKP